MISYSGGGMRGGWRYGAGRPGRNGKVESLLRIDVRDWARRGLLDSANYFGWSWSREDEKIASIGVYVNDTNSLTLKYTWTPDGGEPQSISKSITLAHTSCHYGKSRVWFRCPACYRRVAILYSLKGHFYCRKDLNIAYTSQSLDLTQRMHRKIAKLETRLGENNRKPKRMHTTTYNRILDKIDDAEARLDLALYQFMQRWGQHL